MTTRSEGGFTVVEVIIAIVVLTVGLLGLMTTAALVTRMIARGQRSAVAAAFTQRNLEEQRLRACAVRNPGSADLFRGSQRVARTTWGWTDLGNRTYRLTLSTTYVTAAGRSRTDVTETTISCIQ
ncbi:MAG TPA: prepilin-type N-terminal cleavage/methylation domain-containing protein [Gemmatimonadales bacterium]|nr:prepilin-type N-terminal cleavage/methylation domain-containing protein [Gemmatimonadales bacterium]